MNGLRIWALAWAFGATLKLLAQGLGLGGAELLKTDILAVYAHPDDETGAATTLATYALARNASIAAVYCTRGEGGGNSVGTHSGAALGILREAELRSALQKLGIHAAYFLEADDFSYTEDLMITLERWDHLERLRRLVRLVRALRPEVLICQDPAPEPGQHGHHQAAAILALEAFDAAADPARFPEQLSGEGLTLWRPRKLYWPGPKGTGATVDIEARLPDGRVFSEVVAAALSSHRSQGFGQFKAQPWMLQPRSWTLVKSAVPWAFDETNLFRGLPLEDAVPDRLLTDGDVPQRAGLEFRFLRRKAVEAYSQIFSEQKIGHAARLFTADVPVVAGEASEVGLWVANPDALGVNGLVHFTAPPDWDLHRELHLRFSPQRTNLHWVIVTPPSGTLADVDVVAVVQFPNGELKTSARLHPVPRMTVPSVAAPLSVDASDEDSGWSSLPAQSISWTNAWEGTVRDATDSSGTFRLAHDGSRLFFEIRVRDDQVVSNLAPHDLRGHWRSDSVELCLDPSAGAAHTLACFKLGIVPFDSTGKVGGFRDADAHPGPVGETAPGTRLASWKTSDGYAIRASILLEEAGISLERGRRVGLNVLIYDGDKKNAAAGENINKSRLAWSPRSGVQGRPEDWGKADLR